MISVFDHFGVQLGYPVPEGVPALGDYPEYQSIFARCLQFPLGRDGFSGLTVRDRFYLVIWVSGGFWLGGSFASFTWGKEDIGEQLFFFGEIACAFPGLRVFEGWRLARSLGACHLLDLPDFRSLGFSYEFIPHVPLLLSDQSEVAVPGGRPSLVDSLINLLAALPPPFPTQLPPLLLDLLVEPAIGSQARSRFGDPCFSCFHQASLDEFNCLVPVPRLYGLQKIFADFSFFG